MNVGHFEHSTLRQRTRALDNVLQLAHVARPVVVEQNLHRVSRNALYWLTRVRGKTRNEKIDEFRDVFLALAQRRNDNGHDVQAIVKILAKRALLKRFAE